MIKKIAVVNDISGFGKCSLTAAIPVISALKVQACPLPTSVLSNQTCYSSFYIRDSMLYLAQMADIMLPNVTELCLLSGLDSKKLLLENGTENLAKVKETALKLADKTKTTVIVTGVNTVEEGKEYISNVIADSNKTGVVKRPKLKGGYSGTGDIMASIVSAMAVRGFDITTAVNTAADFISKAVYDTSLENTDVNDGVDFENHLGLLTQI